MRCPWLLNASRWCDFNFTILGLILFDDEKKGFSVKFNHKISLMGGTWETGARHNFVHAQCTLYNCAYTHASTFYSVFFLLFLYYTLYSLKRYYKVGILNVKPKIEKEKSHLSKHFHACKLLKADEMTGPGDEMRFDREKFTSNWAHGLWFHAHQRVSMGYMLRHHNHVMCAWICEVFLSLTSWIPNMPL